MEGLRTKQGEKGGCSRGTAEEPEKGVVKAAHTCQPPNRGSASPEIGYVYRWATCEYLFEDM